MYEQMDFATPTETRAFPHGRVDLLRIGGAEIGRLTLEPGWRWSDDVKPIAGTDLCEAPGWSATSRSSWWTGGAHPTTPGVSRDDH